MMPMLRLRMTREVAAVLVMVPGSRVKCYRRALVPCAGCPYVVCQGTVASLGAGCGS